MKKFLYVYEYANELNDSSQKDVLWNFSRDDMISRLKESGIDINYKVAHGIFRGQKDGGLSFVRLVNFFSMHLFSLFKIIWFRPDVIFVRTSPPLIQIPYSILGRFFGAKVYFWLMDYHPVFGERTSKKGSLKNLFWRFIGFFDKIAIKSQEYAVCLDPAMSELVKSRNPSLKTIVVPTFTISPVDFLDLSRAREKVEEISFVYSGNLGFGHNIDKLEILFKKLRRSVNVKLSYCGKSERANRVLSKLCKRLGIEFKNLGFIKNYSDLGEVYKKNGIDYGIVLLNDELKGLVSPSKFSGYSAFGLPVVYIGPENTNADLLCKKFGGGLSAQTVQELDLMVDKLLDPKTQSILAKGTKNSLEYFSSSSAKILSDFFVLELTSK